MSSVYTFSYHAFFVEILKRATDTNLLCARRATNSGMPIILDGEKGRQILR